MPPKKLPPADYIEKVMSSIESHPFACLFIVQIGVLGVIGLWIWKH